jgi:hypothetical protein
MLLSLCKLAFDGLVIRWQSDDGHKFIDFDANLSSRLEHALTTGQLQFQIAEKNWLFDFTAMTQTNVRVRSTLLCFLSHNHLAM